MCWKMNRAAWEGSKVPSFFMAARKDSGQDCVNPVSIKPGENVITRKPRALYSADKDEAKPCSANFMGRYVENPFGTGGCMAALRMNAMEPFLPANIFGKRSWASFHAPPKAMAKLV